MGLILLEALLALVLLLVIVWWTMFSGRKGGELKPTEQEAPAPVPPAAPDAAAAPTQPPGSA